MVLEVQDIYKNFGEKEVLKGVGFHAASGGALGLLGRNGAGKTTTIRIIMGIFRQDAGEVLIDGVPNEDTDVKIGYMPEERGLYPKKNILEQMVYLGELRGLTAKQAKKRSEYLLERLEATEYINAKLETLSKGNQQKIQLAIAIIHNPDVVILDEPFSGLDPVNSAILKQMLDELVTAGKVVLFSSHQMHYVEEFCKHICIIDKGVIVCDGDIKEIKKTYPRNRIFIAPDVGADLFIKDVQAAGGGFIASAEEKNGGVVVTLKNDGDRKDLLKLLAQKGCAPDTFSVIEPSLTDIFVEKAGDANEPV